MSTVPVFLTFYALAMSMLNTPAPSDLREKQIADAQEAIGSLRDVLVDNKCDAEDDRLALEKYINDISPMLPKAHQDATAAYRALSNVRDVSIRYRHSAPTPGGLGLDEDDYFSHLLYSLAMLDIAMAQAIRSQPEPTIAA